MGSDIWVVLRWWETLLVVGAAAWPLTRMIFGEVWGIRGVGEKKENQGWWDQGYLFSKAVGMATVTWIVYVIGTLRIFPFTQGVIFLSLLLVLEIGLILHVLNYKFGIRNQGEKKRKTIIHDSLFMIRENSHWKQVAAMFLEEFFFLAALLLWSWIKGHEPSIRGLEKFMDFGFMQSTLNARYFPPADMWFPPLPINYYYFGHMVTAVLTRLSGLDLAVTFNLMLATIFAFTFTMSFSIGYELMRDMRHVTRDTKEKFSFISHLTSHISPLFSGLLTAFLVTLAGNMQTIYAFTRGYTGDNVKPFWELGWNVREIWGVGGMREIVGKIGEGMNMYWYANATRFIPYAIHEFPGYSFVVSDVHGHVLSLPFVLLAIAMLIHICMYAYETRDSLAKRIGRTNTIFLQESLAFASIIFYGFLVGVLLMTNALDGPIYFALLAAVLVAMNWTHWSNWTYWRNGIKRIGLVALVAGLTSLPFLWHFKSFVTGLAINCPPEFLANTKVGPILFEGVEKCQRSPIWMLWVLWGFFIYCGGALIGRIFNQTKKFSMKTPIQSIEVLLLVFFFFSIALIIFPEFFYFKDIYPMHFRSNTMFKLGYQAFILFSIVSGYSIVSLCTSFPRRRESSLYFKMDPRVKPEDDKKGRLWIIIFFLFLLPQLFLVSIFPIFSVRSYFNSLRQYQGLSGFRWMQLAYPDDWAGVEWMNTVIRDMRYVTRNNKILDVSRITYHVSPLILVEADGDSYTDYARFSAFTGIPTIIGWPVHEWLWRGGYDVVAPRREDVRQVYESPDVRFTRSILSKYGVDYIVVGALEREKYKNLAEWKFENIGTKVFEQGATVIYQVK